MKTDYTIYRYDGTTERGSVDWPPRPDYDLMAALIEPIVGEPMDHVYVLHDGEQRDMFVDQNGRIRSNPRPLNEEASGIYRNASLSRGLPTLPVPEIVGDAILFHRRVWF